MNPGAVEGGCRSDEMALGVEWKYLDSTTDTGSVRFRFRLSYGDGGEHAESGEDHGEGVCELHFEGLRLLD